MCDLHLNRTDFVGPKKNLADQKVLMTHPSLHQMSSNSTFHPTKIVSFTQSLDFGNSEARTAMDWGLPFGLVQSWLPAAERVSRAESVPTHTRIPERSWRIRSRVRESSLRVYRNGDFSRLGTCYFQRMPITLLISRCHVERFRCNAYLKAIMTNGKLLQAARWHVPRTARRRFRIFSLRYCGVSSRSALADSDPLHVFSMVIALNHLLLSAAVFRVFHPPVSRPTENLQALCYTWSAPVARLGSSLPA